MIDTIEQYITTKYEGMIRRSGEPVVSHSIQMKEILNDNGYDEILQIIALLHDVIEDTDVSISSLKEDLKEIIFDELTLNEILLGVDSLTKYDHESLEQSIEKAKNNKYGRVIKGVDRLQNAITTYETNSQEFISGFIYKTVKYYIPALKEVNNPFLDGLYKELERLYSYCCPEAVIWLNKMIPNFYEKTFKNC